MPPRPGEKVLVATNVRAGAFPGERLVSVNTVGGGTVSGFARADSIVQQDNDSYLRAEVRNVAAGTLTVKLDGSFFTTTGLADVPSTIVRKASG
jgi:hypothetical protein